MQNINQFILNNISFAFFVLLALFLTMTVFFIASLIRNRNISKRYRSLMRGMKDKNLEEILFQNINILEKALQQTEDLEIQLRKLEKASMNSIQKVGIVRFNAFEDTGSDLSFAIALLNAHRDGVIISSIFSRHDSRIYAKPVTNGSSPYNLSNEEQKALAEALGK